MNQKSKDFLNSEQLIENFKSKGINIINEDNTKNILKKIIIIILLDIRDYLKI